VGAVMVIDYHERCHCCVGGLASANREEAIEPCLPSMAMYRRQIWGEGGARNGTNGEVAALLKRFDR